jgi:hypothetical protein
VKDNLAYGFRVTMAQEGVLFVNDPNDRGGPTRMGLTLGLMKSLRLDLNNDGIVTVDDVRLVTEEVVLDVYRKEFWNRVKADTLPTGQDVQTADFWFNAGPSRARDLLRKSPNMNGFALHQIAYYLSLADRLPGYVGFFRGLTRRALSVLVASAAICEYYETSQAITRIRFMLSEADKDSTFRGIFREKVRSVLYG